MQAVISAADAGELWGNSLANRNAELFGLF